MRVNAFFQRTSGIRPKEQVVARVAEASRTLSYFPVWMTGTHRCFLRGISIGGETNGIPFEFTRNRSGSLFYDFTAEKRMSSLVGLCPLVIFPREETGIAPFQVFSKTKERIPMKRLWEFLMLDLWSELLRNYTKVSNICITSPQSFTMGGECGLFMGFEQGTIGTHLNVDYDPKETVALRSRKNFSLYQAFAFHLGALARIKEDEELTHGDYQLRHVLFDAGGRLRPEFYVAKIIRSLEGKPLSINSFLTEPHLSVVDIEHGLRATKTDAQTENEKMLMQARINSAGNGTKPKIFEAAYRDGYDSITPQGLTQGIVDAQYERWGFSVDRLF